MAETHQLFGTQPPAELSRYAYALTAEQVEKVLHYTHLYPNLHGYTKDFFAKNYPGQTLHSFMTVFQTAGILTKRGTHRPGGRCKVRFHTIYFTDHNNFFVQWKSRSQKKFVAESQPV